MGGQGTMKNENGEVTKKGQTIYELTKPLFNFNLNTYTTIKGTSNYPVHLAKLEDGWHIVQIYDQYDETSWEIVDDLYLDDIEVKIIPKPSPKAVEPTQPMRDLEEYEVVNEYVNSGKYKLLDQIKSGSVDITMFGDTHTLRIESREIDGEEKGGLVDLIGFINGLKEMFEDVVEDPGTRDIAQTVFGNYDLEIEQGGFDPTDDVAMMNHLYFQVWTQNQKILLPDSDQNMVDGLVPLSSLLDYLLTFSPNLGDPTDQEKIEETRQRKEDLSAEVKDWVRQNRLQLRFNAHTTLGFKGLSKDERGPFKYIDTDENFSINMTGSLTDNFIFKMNSILLKIPESDFGSVHINSIFLQNTSIDYNLLNKKSLIKAKSASFKGILFNKKNE